MDLTALFWLLLNICLCAARNEEEITYSKDGWIPIPNDRIFNNYWYSKLGTTKPINTWDSSATNKNDMEENFIKLIDAPTFNNKFTEISELLPDVSQSKVSGFHKKRNEYTEPSSGFLKEKHILEASDNNSNRKGKTLDSTFNLNSENQIITPKDNNNIILEDTDFNKQNNTYEVFEDIDDSELLATNQNIILNNKNNVNQEAEVKNNYTNNLFNILSNYNIRNSDKLPNYPVSLRQNSRNSNTRDYVYMHVPIQIPIKYNNANHLLVDPILAVFLSNYGYYIPGQFGIQRNYKNLYGNLASNNIHNNKPFGSYKLYSDTDSSF